MLVGLDKRIVLRPCIIVLRLVFSLGQAPYEEAQSSDVAWVISIYEGLFLHRLIPFGMVADVVHRA